VCVCVYVLAATAPLPPDSPPSPSPPTTHHVAGLVPLSLARAYFP